MLTIVRDYFFINRSKIFRFFYIPYLLFLAGQIVLMIQKRMIQEQESYNNSMIAVGIVSAIFLAGAVGLFVFVFGILDACLKGFRLARDAGMSIREYVKSDDYRLHGKSGLKRTDKERKWL